jgi:hypothetical protein
MALPIIVAPSGDAWTVRSEELNTELTYAQGGRAESAARALAAQVAAQGRNAEVQIFLRDGALAGRFIHPAIPASMALTG